MLTKFGLRSKNIYEEIKLDRLLSILFYLPVVFIALPFHEAAHAYAAYKMGDNTAKYCGRLTLNPLKHLDPIGVVCLLLGGFGWAKPVPVEIRRFKNPKVGFAITAIAGPISNLLLALIAFLILLLIRIFVPTFFLFIGKFANIYFVIYQLLVVFCVSNVMLACFNLIPIPPLDGSRIASLILPDKAYVWFLKNEKYFQLVLIAAVVLGVFDKPLGAIQDFILNIILTI